MADHFAWQVSYGQKELVSTKKSLYDSKVLIEKFEDDNFKAAENHFMSFQVFELNCVASFICAQKISFNQKINV